MKYLLLCLVSFNIWASEVATLEINSSNKSELVLIFSDKEIQSVFEKNSNTKYCKPRIGYVNEIRQNFLPHVCRAEIVKFLLDQNYQMMNDITFSK